MRKVIYDNILREGMERTNDADLKNAFDTVLNCENDEELNQYYANMDEFFGANNTDITLISAHYLLTKKAHTCEGGACQF